MSWEWIFMREAMLLQRPKREKHGSVEIRWMESMVSPKSGFLKWGDWRLG